MANIYDYLLKRKTDLEARITEAQLKAQAPFEDELNALGLALEALERGGLADGRAGAEEASFAPTPAGRRGRKARSTREMVLLVLGRNGVILPASDIAQQLAKRWARHVPLASMLATLEALQQDGLARRAGRGWACVGSVRQDQGVSPESPTLNA